MEFKDLVRKRRSCREFQPGKISDNQLKYILEAGCWAPSPLNLQPFEVIVITDPEIRARIREVAEDAKKEVADKGGPKWAENYNVNFLEEAAVLLVVVVDPSQAGLGKYFGQKYGSIEAGAACVQNMLLATADLGLGGLWFTFFNPENLKPLLNVPDTMEIVSIVPVGIPKAEIKPVHRKALKLHDQAFGRSFTK